MDMQSTSPTAAAANDLFAGLLERGDEESPRSVDADRPERERYSNPWDDLAEGDDAMDQDEVRFRLPALLMQALCGW